MHESSRTTAQNSTRSPVKTPWIISFSSVKILNLSNRTIRPKRANFSILRIPRTAVSLPLVFSSSTAASVSGLALKVIVMSTRARTTQSMSNQLQYQSPPNKYSFLPKTRILTAISAMKKIVKHTSRACHTGLSGHMSALKPTTPALTIMTKAGIISSISKNVAFSSEPSISSTTRSLFGFIFVTAEDLELFGVNVFRDRLGLWSNCGGGPPGPSGEESTSVVTIKPGRSKQGVFKVVVVVMTIGLADSSPWPRCRKWEIGSWAGGALASRCRSSLFSPMMRSYSDVKAVRW
mmetsp:Transcript_26752/g.50307  ORF Transcript_26752/g.50307 Transcript_26752/m.50307 type:complete len:292 (-) Transcript_26752:83-958(-)